MADFPIKKSMSPSEVQASLHRGLILEYLSIGWMTIECTVSLGAGFFAGSFALIAFGGDSFIELISAYAVADYLRKREREGSESRILQRTERITSALLFALIPSIALGAAYSFFVGVRAEGSPVGIGVAVGAVVIMPFLWLGKRRIGKQTRCVPLCNDAVESATCLFMSIALLGGLLATYILGLWWVDYLAAGVILAFVAKEAVEAVREPGENPSV